MAQHRAGLFPEGSAAGLAARGRIPTGGLPSLLGNRAGSTSQTSQSTGTELDLYAAGFDASWEIDLFGGTRRGIESARAQAEAQEAQLADIQVQLAAEVAQAYVNLRDVQRREVLLRRSREIEQRMLDLTRQRRELGTASQVDVERLDTQLISSWLADIVPCMYDSATLAMVLSSDCISVARMVHVVTSARCAGTGHGDAIATVSVCDC